MNFIYGLIVFLFVIYLYYLSNSVYNDELNGAWCATKKFAHNAELDDMIVFLNTKTEKAYFLLYKDDKVVYDKILDFKIKSTWLPFIQKEPVFSVKMDGLEDIIPETFNLKLKLGKGRIKFYDDEKVYANLQRLYF